jgi:hypothetical protein
MHYFLLVLLFLLPSHAFAQKVQYVDYQPSYKVWENFYILDKITYTQDRTIFHFRYVEVDKYSVIVFFGVLNEDNRWCLVAEQNGQKEVFPLIELRNIARNGSVLEKSFKDNSLAYNTELHEVYTMEVHFPRLPNHITKVDFLEGEENRGEKTHFHCLKVKIKPLHDATLGTETDMAKRIDAFELKYTGKKNAYLPPKPMREKEEENKAQEREDDDL